MAKKNGYGTDPKASSAVMARFNTSAAPSGQAPAMTAVAAKTKKMIPAPPGRPASK